MNKSNKAYKTIGEVVKILKLESNKKDNLAAHTIRFWEKQFNVIVCGVCDIIVVTTNIIVGIGV